VAFFWLIIFHEVFTNWLIQVSVDVIDAIAKTGCKACRDDV
jgi:hypothetical protein